MSLEKFIEDQVTKAMAKGEFDNLPGKGKPLDLDWYFSIPEPHRLGYSILKSGNFLPEEAELLKEIEALRKRLASSSDEAERDEIGRSINDKSLRLNLLMEKHRGKK